MSYYSNSKYWIADRMKILVSIGVINLAFLPQLSANAWNKSVLEVQQIVSGRVLNEQGTPLEGVSVSLVSGGASVSTDAKGSYAIPAGG
ncbi:carboxypeptidase-like regulatory domain-containing protein [Sphingobacterium hotanense]|uniref:Carboxypeptidase regulatory-like domain-containing protein n=1 Tax=Sphingobacterium hotanense TaxID=649196 RepID=A0ABT7NS20_9SPHI|nr:carboxypeptidase-like regulatory domain-containing protein [Sphingobacterium hotanense]MDM1050051.1 carboxypeptidase regulatory-like domain-containing protein [Sphingobacterium hotanense]